MQTQGSLHDGGLATLLQSMQAERATGTLTIDNGGDSASLYFLFGHLFHASGPVGRARKSSSMPLAGTTAPTSSTREPSCPPRRPSRPLPAELIAAAESRTPAATSSTGASTWPDAAPAYSAPDTYSPAPAASLPEPIEEPAYAIAGTPAAESAAETYSPEPAEPSPCSDA